MQEGSADTAEGLALGVIEADAHSNDAAGREVVELEGIVAAILLRMDHLEHLALRHLEVLLHVDRHVRQAVDVLEK